MFSFALWDPSTWSLFFFYVHRFLTRLICLPSSWLSPLIVFFFFPAVIKWLTGATIEREVVPWLTVSGGSPIMAGKGSWHSLVHCSGSMKLRLLTFWKPKKQRGNSTAPGFFPFIPSNLQLLGRHLLHSVWVSPSS